MLRTDHTLSSLALIGLTGCRGCSSPPPPPGHVDAGPPEAGIAVADASTEDLSVAMRRELLPPEGRVFFGKARRRAAGVDIDELHVIREASGARVVFKDEEYAATISAADAGASQLKLAMKGIEAPIDLVIHDDGSFEGAETYKDGSKTEWDRTPYRGVAEGQLTSVVGFEGFLSKTVRYRMKVVRRGDGVDGVARYPETREDLRVRGTLDPLTRRLTADEIGRDGKVTGRIDAFVLGHVVPKPFTNTTTVVGTWSSADGARKLRLLMQEGFYPDRIGVAGGVFLSAQERYTDDCGVVEDRIFPVLDKAPAGVAAPFEGALGALVALGIGPASDGPLPPKRIAPGATIRERCPVKVDLDRRARGTGLYTTTKLHGAWVALEIEHYEQHGMTRGSLWHDCIAADLSTGEIVEPGKLLDDATRLTLTTRARAAALASVPDAGGSDDGIGDGMRDAANSLDLDGSVPLCIGEKTIRFAIGRHPLFGPDHPSFDRADVVRLLPPGKLRELMTGSADPSIHDE